MILDDRYNQRVAISSKRNSKDFGPFYLPKRLNERIFQVPMMFIY